MPAPETSPGKPRLVVLTDISSLTPGVREPDDGQSMIRLMLYSNEIEIMGLVAGSNMGHGQVTRPELIREVVNAYGQVRPNLLLHDAGYPSVEYLLSRIKAGQAVAGPDRPAADSVGRGKDTEASEWITRVVDETAPDPLWITIWGGSADLAQALFSVRETRAAEEAADFVARLRVRSVGDQDSTGRWIKENFPDLFITTHGCGIRGMYRGGDESLVSSEWVERHIRNGHGPLGALYPNYDGGDIWSSRLGRVRGVKEGDTPSFLGLIPNGLNNPSEPSWGGWGGRFQKDPDGPPRRFIDAIDFCPNMEADPAPQMSAVWRWRPAFQADFQARLDWCVKPCKAANHAPVARVSGPLVRSVAPGETVTLDATASTDPDGNRLSFQWLVYREAGNFQGPLIIENAKTPVAKFVVPKAESPSSFHIILTVSDDGEPSLSGYQRILFLINP